VLAAAAIGIGLLFLLDLEVAEDEGGDEPPQPNGVVVPDVIGKPSYAAQAEIEALGLTVTVIGGKPLENDPSDVIEEQVPPPETEVPFDATVTLDAGR
jgi:hypothetical protein